MIFNENEALHNLEKNDIVSINYSSGDNNEGFAMSKRNSHLIEVERNKDDDTQLRNLSESMSESTLDVVKPHYDVYQLYGNTNELTEVTNGHEDISLYNY